MIVDSEDYRNHEIFTRIPFFINFYKNLSYSVMGFCSGGTTGVVNIDTYVYSSIQGTLNSIQDILSNGRINDSYALVRKYYDAAIINIYVNLYLRDNYDIENIIVEKIENWLKGREKLPDYRTMKNYIRSSRDVSEITKIIDEESYKNIRERCNDHTHYNFFHNVLINDIEVHLESRNRELDTLLSDIQGIFILHCSYLFFLNEHYMASTDYVDSLDMGMTPEPGSQCWVATFIQEAFDDVIDKYRPDIAELIRKSTSMDLS